MHRVYMQFEFMLDVWRVTLKGEGPPLKDFTFVDDSKLEEMVRRGNGLKTLADKQAFHAAVRQKRGGIMLLLSDAQLAAVRR